VDATRDAASATDYFRLVKRSNSAGTLKPEEEQVSTTQSRISEINLVILAVSDVDRAIEFYTDKLGFEKRVDVPFGGEYRWVEVAPAGAPTGIALAPPRPGDSVEPRETGISLRTDDIDATHAHLRSAGVDVDAEVSRMGGPVPPMFWFRDADGYSLMVVEQA
jgi:catechol 2,3-dioxygenase-like lactoylglutathione lyase family enzyme